MGISRATSSELRCCIGARIVGEACDFWITPDEDTDGYESDYKYSDEVDDGNEFPIVDGTNGVDGEADGDDENGR